VERCGAQDVGLIERLAVALSCMGRQKQGQALGVVVGRALMQRDFVERVEEGQVGAVLQQDGQALAKACV
jgi:hypothetical protein